eukprot:6634587-Alexandrium_andersonii.AAC.1
MLDKVSVAPRLRTEQPLWGLESADGWSLQLRQSTLGAPRSAEPPGLGAEALGGIHLLVDSRP